jgi:hypothetical protein
MVHETRVIPLVDASTLRAPPGRADQGRETTSSESSRAESRDDRPHVGNSIRLDMGDARGYWEGDSLVVESRNFRERSIYRNANPDSLRIVERFLRTSATSVEWSVTIDDPKTWTKPWTFTLPLTMNESEPVLEYACHEGNYSMRNMLSASRAEEAAAARGQNGEKGR